MPTITTGPGSPSGSSASISGSDALGLITLNLSQSSGSGYVFEVQYVAAYAEPARQIELLPVTSNAPRGTINLSSGIWQFTPAGAIPAGVHSWVYRVQG